MSATLFVRKMVSDEPNDRTESNKRALQMDEAVDVSKKAKIDKSIEEDAPSSDAHLNKIEALNQQLKQSELEIESLRKQLTQKDFEISALHKMVASLNKQRKK